MFIKLSIPARIPIKGFRIYSAEVSSTPPVLQYHQCESNTLAGERLDFRTFQQNSKILNKFFSTELIVLQYWATTVYCTIAIINGKYN